MIIIRGSEFGVRNCHCETRHPERRNREGSRHSSPWILSLRSRMTAAIGPVVMVLLLAVAAFAAPKSASAYYSDAAFQYIENRLPSAEITCNEGLQYYPNDQKLQMLLDRIHEAKDEQKNENKKNDKNQDNNQDQNQQDQQNQDQNKDQNQDQNGDDQNKDQNQDQNQDQNGGQSSSSQEGGSSESNSSDSNGGAGEQPQPEQPEEGSSDSQGDSSNDGAEPEEQPVQMGEMSPEEAAQLLKDFDEQNGERKPWKPIRGQARPAKDW